VNNISLFTRHVLKYSRHGCNIFVYKLAFIFKWQYIIALLMRIWMPLTQNVGYRRRTEQIHLICWLVHDMCKPLILISSFSFRLVDNLANVRLTRGLFNHLCTLWRNISSLGVWPVLTASVYCNRLHGSTTGPLSTCFDMRNKHILHFTAVAASLSSWTTLNVFETFFVT